MTKLRQHVGVRLVGLRPGVEQTSISSRASWIDEGIADASINHLIYQGMVIGACGFQDYTDTFVQRVQQGADTLRAVGKQACLIRMGQLKTIAGNVNPNIGHENISLFYDRRVPPYPLLRNLVDTGFMPKMPFALMQRMEGRPIFSTGFDALLGCWSYLLPHHHKIQG
jgi:hypothetical protein